MEPQVAQPIQPNPAPQQLQPLYSEHGWYFPQGTLVVFQARKIMLCFYPGWFVVFDAKTGQEIRRVALTPDVRPKKLLGWAWITPVEGKKITMFSRSHTYGFYHPVLIFITAVVGFVGRLLDNTTPLYFTILILSAAALIGLIAYGQRRAIRFAQATRQAMGQHQ